MTSAPAPIASFPIELGGKTRHLKMGMRALYHYERITGRNLFQEDPEARISLADTIALLTAALRYDEPTLTPEQVADWLDGADMDAILAAIREAKAAAAVERAEGKPAQNSGEPAPA